MTAFQSDNIFAQGLVGLLERMRNKTNYRGTLQFAVTAKRLGVAVCSLWVARLTVAFALCVLLPAPALAAGRYHTVSNGETLDAIAKTYRVPIYSIAKSNNISTNSMVKSGSRIWIPGVSPTAKVSSPKPIPNPPPNKASRTTVTSSAANRSSSRSTVRSVVSSGGVVVVAKGDTLWGIANRHGLTVSQLAAENNLSNSAQLNIGQKLRLPGGPASSGVTVRSSGGNSTRNSASSSSRSNTPTLATSGGGGSIPTRTIGNAPTTPSGASTSGYQWPVNGVVLRNFENKTDSKHFGVDIEVPVGTPVRAAKTGKVVFVGRIPAYGNMVIVSHDSNYASCYAYCGEILVRENQHVSRGDVIARSGDPEKSNTPYLHFQIRKNGDAVNPRPFLP